MESRIQALLDDQWDALESRSGNIRAIRRNIGESIVDLRRQRTHDLSKLEDEMQSHQKKLDKYSEATARREELELILRKEEAGEAAERSRDLTRQIDEISKTISELEQAKQSLIRERQTLDSTIASRTSMYKDALATIREEFPPEEAESYDNLRNRIAEWEKNREGIKQEIDAAYKGKELWDKVSSELQALDDSLNVLNKNQLPQASFQISKCASELEKHLDTASTAGWSALTVAIGHELQILHEASKAIQERNDS